tara:strand:- start:314 stop:571 length:258 start_codon:yes stop_codon:yes gene_type:complete
MEKEEIKKEVSDWFYKKHYYCKDVDSMLTFTAKSVIDEIVEFTTDRVKNNGVLGDVSVSVCCVLNCTKDIEPNTIFCKRHNEIEP